MGDHFVDVVDEKDRVIGQDLKSQKPVKNFISRVVAIFLANSKGNLLICKRAPHKKNAADLYDLAAFGNVILGESYEEAAIRELKEELDISCDLKMLDKFYQEISNDGKKFKIFCGVFLGVTDDCLRLNEELVEVKEMSFGEIETELRLNSDSFCPGFVNDFMKVKDKLRLLRRCKVK